MGGDAMETKRYMDVGDLGAYLGISKANIYALVKDRKIPFRAIGKLLRFDVKMIDEWMHRNATRARPKSVHDVKDSLDNVNHL